MREKLRVCKNETGSLEDLCDCNSDTTKLIAEHVGTHVGFRNFSAVLICTGFIFLTRSHSEILLWGSFPIGGGSVVLSKYKRSNQVRTTLHKNNINIKHVKV